MPRCDCPNCDAPGSHKFDFAPTATAIDIAELQPTSGQQLQLHHTNEFIMEATGNSPSNNGNNNGNGNNGNNALMLTEAIVRTPKSLPSRIDPSRVLPACFLIPWST
jgi:hypothetical protein